MPTFQITCDTPGASIYYTTDGSEPNRNSTLYTGQFAADSYTSIRAIGSKDNYPTSEGIYGVEVGTEIVKDGISAVCIYDAGSEQEWGRYIFVDKNHDLSYYITGSDYVDSNDYNQNPGTFGYKWGFYKIYTGINNKEIGTGLYNTNSLIALNFQPDTSGWRVLWDMVEQFRSTHSDDWFVPSLNEIQEVSNQRSYLSNLSLKNIPTYWSSTEETTYEAYIYYFYSGNSYSSSGSKNDQIRRTRLCFYI